VQHVALYGKGDALDLQFNHFPTRHMSNKSLLHEVMRDMLHDMTSALIRLDCAFRRISMGNVTLDVAGVVQLLDSSAVDQAHCQDHLKFLNGIHEIIQPYMKDGQLSDSWENSITHAEWKMTLGMVSKFTREGVLDPHPGSLGWDRHCHKTYHEMSDWTRFFRCIAHNTGRADIRQRANNIEASIIRLKFATGLSFLNIAHSIKVEGAIDHAQQCRDLMSRARTDLLEARLLLHRYTAAEHCRIWVSLALLEVQAWCNEMKRIWRDLWHILVMIEGRLVLKGWAKIQYRKAKKWKVEFLNDRLQDVSNETQETMWRTDPGLRALFFGDLSTGHLLRKWIVQYFPEGMREYGVLMRPWTGELADRYNESLARKEE
jgi:hypothetical protein